MFRKRRLEGGSGGGASPGWWLKVIHSGGGALEDWWEKVSHVVIKTVVIRGCSNSDCCDRVTNLLINAMFRKIS